MKWDVNNSRAWSLKTVLLLDQKKYEETLECLEKAIQITNEKVLWNNKGVALDGFPNVKHVLINKYKALDKLGKTKEAELCYEGSQKIDLGYNNSEVYDAYGRLIS